MIYVKGIRTKIHIKFALTLGVFGALFYPIFVDPLFTPEKFKDRQRISRKNIRREDIQPGNMNIWRNPFADNYQKEKQEQEINKGEN